MPATPLAIKTAVSNRPFFPEALKVGLLADARRFINLSPGVVFERAVHRFAFALGNRDLQVCVADPADG